jgi:hypothetical protein
VHSITVQSLIALGVTVLVVFRFARRELVERVVRARTLWIRPALLVVLTGYMTVLTVMLDPHGIGEMIAALAVGIVLGAITGALIVRNSSFRAADQPGAVRVQGNRVTFAVWIGALAIRLVARYVLPGGGDPRTQFPLNCGTIALVAVAFVIIAVAFYGAIRRYAGVNPGTEFA